VAPGGDAVHSGRGAEESEADHSSVSPHRRKTDAPVSTIHGYYFLNVSLSLSLTLKKKERKKERKKEKTILQGRIQMTKKNIKHFLKQIQMLFF